MKNVTRLYALLATALMITTFVTTSDAQRGPGGGGQGGPQQGGPGGGGGMRQRNQQSGPMYIIKMPTVQAHLNLTQTQKDSIAALRPPQGGSGQGGPGQGGPGGGGQGGPQGGGPGGGGQGGPQGGGPGGDGENRPNPLAEILNETQMNRLNQLALQFDAPMSIMDRKSAQALALTEAQRTQLDTIIKNAFPRPQGGPGGGQGGPGGNGGGQGGPGGGQGGNRPTPPTFAEMQAKKAAAFNLAWEVLNATQKEKWNTMTGAKFTNWVEVPRPHN